MADLLTISEVSRRSGVASSALRFYEDAAADHGPSAPAPATAATRARSCAGLPSSCSRRRLACRWTEIGAELAQLPQNRAPDRAGLGAHLQPVDAPRRRAHRRARTAARQPDRLHRVRLPVAAAVPARQSRRSRRQRGAGPRYWIGDKR